MPITVKHEADIGGLAGLSALAGALSRSEQPRTPVAGRGGGGGGRIQAPVMLPGIPSYEDLPHQLQRQEIEGQQQQMMMRADLERQEAMRQEELEREEKLWVEEFTPQQKHEMTKNRNSRQAVLTQMQSGEIDSLTGMRMLRQLDSEYEAYSPQKRPRNSSDPQPYKPGRGPGEEWMDDWGNIKTRKPNGEIVTQVPFEKTQAGMQSKIQADRERAELEREQKREDRILTMHEKLKLLQIDRLGEHGEKLGTRFLEPDEIREKLAGIYQELDRDGPDPKPWWVKLREEGIDVYRIDKELPDSVGYAQAWLRHMRGKYGGYDGLPLYKQAAWEEMMRVYEEYKDRVKQEG